MAFYSYIFSANYKGFKKRLKDIAKKEHKSYPLLLIDTYYSILRYGVGLTDYLSYEFFKKNSKLKKEYVGIKLQDKFYAKVSPAEYKQRYTIKPRFMKEFKEYVKRDFINPEEASFEDFKEFISKRDVWMSKPFDGLGGEDVKKVYKKDIKDLKEYYDHLKNNRVFIEDLVKQHESLNKFCDSSVNTIRIMTFNNHGNPEVLAAVLRVGNGYNDVDNFHAGGTASLIDLESGKLLTNGICKDLSEFEYHPKTNVKFLGYQIPYWKEIVDMVKKASLESDKILVVGWDVAVTKDGPLIIEGNRRPGLDVIQVASKRGRKDIIRHVLDELSTKK